MGALLYSKENRLLTLFNPEKSHLLLNDLEDIRTFVNNKNETALQMSPRIVTNRIKQDTNGK